MISAVNPAMLKWARVRSGLSLIDLASKMKRNTDEIRMWENGKRFPSYGALEDLAYCHFKVPLAIFFFSSPPEIDDPVGKFRRLPKYELTRFSSDTIQKIRLAQAYQYSLEELFTGSDPEQMIHRSLNPNKLSLEVLAQKVRDYMGITLSQQFKFRSSNQAFKAWRHAIENAGVFTFKDSFKDGFLSGFCLLHKQYPIIMINNSNSFTRQVFTLIHELGHILYGVNGVTDIDEYYFRYLKNQEQDIEVQCNRFAAEVLVPSESFRLEIPFFEEKGDEAISVLANKYSVSREVILRRLLDFRKIDNKFYSTQAEKWNKDYLRSKKHTRGGDWYLTRIAYLGKGYVQSAFHNYQRGRFDKTTLANHLNIKAKYLNKFESYLWR